MTYQYKDYLEFPAAYDFPYTEAYPRLRYMGSKYKLTPQLAQVFNELQFDTVLDAFSGSGVVSCLLKEMGKEVTANDFMSFPSTVSMALIENSSEKLTEDDVALLLSPNEDGRSFIRDTFHGIYFPDDDHSFLDRVWSHLVHLGKEKKALAVSAMCLAAARKQPRGVFTITDFRYDDGRKALRTPLQDLFLDAVREYNSSVFDNARDNHSVCGDVFAIDAEPYDLVYFDPPYAPPKDDADYMKRYHFLEGLSVYWDGKRIMEETKTKKIEKMFTPFAYKRTICEALMRLFHQFRNSTIVMSYSSNSIPSEMEIFRLLHDVKKHVRIVKVPHKYSFGTHDNAVRRDVDELIFIAE